MNKDDLEFHSGAVACWETVQRLKPMLIGDSTQTCSIYFKARDEAVAQILGAAGPLPAQAAGALAILAEYIVDVVQNGEAADIDTWHADTLMNPAELEANRLAFTAEVERPQSQEYRSNVVPLRPAQ